MADEFISTQQAADLIGISRVAVFNAIKAGKIKAFKVGRGYNVLRESAIEYRDNRNSKAKSGGQK